MTENHHINYVIKELIYKGAVYAWSVDMRKTLNVVADNYPAGAEYEEFSSANKDHRGFAVPPVAVLRLKDAACFENRDDHRMAG